MMVVTQIVQSMGMVVMIEVIVKVDTDEDTEYTAATLLAGTIKAMLRPEVPVRIVCDI